MDQPSAVAFTAFADVWPRATEMEMVAALCAIGAGRNLTLDFLLLSDLFCLNFMRSNAIFSFCATMLFLKLGHSCIHYMLCPKTKVFVHTLFYIFYFGQEI